MCRICPLCIQYHWLWVCEAANAYAWCTKCPVDLGTCPQLGLWSWGQPCFHVLLVSSCFRVGRRDAVSGDKMLRSLFSCTGLDYATQYPTASPSSAAAFVLMATCFPLILSPLPMVYFRFGAVVIVTSFVLCVLCPLCRTNLTSLHLQAWVLSGWRSIMNERKKHAVS